MRVFRSPYVWMWVTGFVVATISAPPGTAAPTPWIDPSPSILPAPTIPVRADTVWYGDYLLLGNEYHARASSNKAAVEWTFDRGHGPFNDEPRIDNGEGWGYRELSTQLYPYGREIDSGLDLGNGVQPPVIAGTGSFWFGADEPSADAACWPCGPGYGNHWRQRVLTEPLTYDGSGAIQISFLYFSDCEPCYDGTQVYLRRADGTELLLNPEPPGCANNVNWSGGFTGQIGSYLSPAPFNRMLQPFEIGPPQWVRFVFEFRSDILFSDEDCDFPTERGPFGMDNLMIVGGGINKFYDFDSHLRGLQSSNMTARPGDPICDPVTTVSVGCYGLSGSCNLSQNVLETAAGDCMQGTHPNGQHFWLESPVCDLGNQPHTNLLMQMDIYHNLPTADGVLVRPNWRYYPYVCSTTGQTMWSPLVSASWIALPGPACSRRSFSGTQAGVPLNAEQVVAIFELYSSCADFGITECTGQSNDSPLLDNLVVARVGGLPASDVGDPGGPRAASLSVQVDPNPFMDQTTIRFQVTDSGSARLEVFDVAGRLIRTLLDRNLTPGVHATRWDGTNTQGQRLGSGAFWVQLTTGSRRIGSKLLLMR